MSGGGDNKDINKPVEEKRKRGGSQPGVRRGPYRERGTPPANPPKGDPHPKRKGPHHDDQYR